MVYSDLCFDVTGNKIEKIERPYNREELIDMILKLNECRQNESKQKFEYKNQIDSVLNYIENELHKCQIILDNKSDSEISSKKAKAKKECLKIAKSKLLK